MAALGGIPISPPTIQNALFRSSSTVEQAAVNRKVQGSNPCSGATCSGAKIELEFWRERAARESRTSFVHPLYILCNNFAVAEAQPLVRSFD